MLTELKISNFAIIESQTVSFGPGLNVISGETGSGKSILLQALEMVLGGRPKPQFLRDGSDGWEVEALFDLSGLAPGMRHELPDIADGDELAIHRSLNRSGRGKVYINGHLSTVALLESIAGNVMNICSQGQKNRLFDPAFHLELVDGFAGCGDQREQYRRLYCDWKEAQKLLHLSITERQKVMDRREQLEETVQELESAHICATARSDLESEVKSLSSSEQTIQLLSTLAESLRSEGGISGRLAGMGQDFSMLARLDPAGRQEQESYRSIMESLRDLARTLEQRASRVITDEHRLDDLRERLAEIARLERKYRTDCAGLLLLLDQSRRELELLDSTDKLEELRSAAEQLNQAVTSKAEALSQARREAFEPLTRAVETDLDELNMKGARLRIACDRVNPGPNGIDQLEIFIAPNPGEGFKALAQIASGGELSRILLVLKKVLRERSGVNVLVFDEVDSGISGAVARSVGLKLKELSRHSQVLCITHLAQVASLADQHFCVSKQSGPRTVSILTELKSQDEKIEEIARMLAGYTVSRAARESARELLTSK